MGTWGGKQPGAGRPKGKKNQATMDKEMAIAIIRKKVFDELIPLLEAKFDLAKGCWVGKQIGNELVNVYQKEPDREAIEDLLNRSIGKVKETMDIDLKSGDIKTLALSIQKLANGKDETISATTLQE